MISDSQTPEQPTAPDSPPAEPVRNPNSAESAGEMLASFIRGYMHLDYPAEHCGQDNHYADERTAVLAAQLLSIATSAERLADAMERIAGALDGAGSQFGALPIATALDRISYALAREARHG
jgi:hypothetical protein